jgi:nucleoside phosphorylase
MRQHRKDVLLDILSPDNNALYGAGANYSHKTQLNILRCSLNIAVLLCGERCLVPPFFPLESRTTRQALEASSEFITAGLIAFPVRESSIAEFIAKKELEYAGVRATYKGVYSREAAHFLRKYAHALTKRHAYVGQAMLPIWEAGPDASAVWAPIKERATADLVEQVRKAPYWLKENGESITWAGMRRFLTPDAVTLTFEINQALQHEYMQIYLREYGATIVSRLPPKPTDLFLEATNLSYDYVCWRDAMRMLGLWPGISELQPADVVRLRNTYGFLAFMAAFEALCVACDSARIVRIAIAAAVDASRRENVARRVAMMEPLMRQRRPIMPNHANALSDYLAMIAERLEARTESRAGVMLLGSRSIEGGSMVQRADVVLITALREERDALLAKVGEYRKLDKDDVDTDTYYEARIHTSRTDNAVYRVIVTSLADMGPLMAHGKAQSVVRRWHPKYVVLVGIACGLPAETAHGDVMIATIVADYTLGKIMPDGHRKVRWSPHPAGPNLLDAAMNLDDEWRNLISVHRPGSGQPRMVFGVIASGGNVISNDDVVTDYLDDWPKLIGIEMEAGGTAAGLHNTPDRPEFLMVKAVSDFGKDKHDDAVKPWRPYACDVAAALVVAMLREGPGPSVQGSLDSAPATMLP